MLGWLDGLRVNRENVDDMIFKEARVLVNKLERVNDANWKNGSHTDKGFLVTRMGIFGKSRGSMHRAMVITSLLKERGSGHITRGWFAIHLWQMEKSQGIYISLCPQNFPPKKRGPAKSRGTYRWRRRCSSRKNENSNGPDDHFQRRGGRRPRDRGHVNGTIQKLSTVEVMCQFSLWKLSVGCIFMIPDRSQHSHFLGVSWKLQEMYKASGSILLLIKMDFDQFQNQKLHELRNLSEWHLS